MSTATTLTWSEFSQDSAGAAEASARGPVFITGNGQPTHVLLTYARYQELAGTKVGVVTLLAMPEAAAIDAEPVRMGPICSPAELETSTYGLGPSRRGEVSRRPRPRMNRRDRAFLAAFLALHKLASESLGERNWSLLQSFGRLMTGRYSGLYVSGIPPQEALSIVEALTRGETVPVHLMHRHRSGDCESSNLRLVGKRFVMSFADRDELA